MIITVASGKGGTGKTTIATSLALSIGARYFLDCDVETPNAHIFLQPELTSADPVAISIPEIRPDRCDGCGICAQVCQFHAIVMIAGKPIVFPELCHGCGSCSWNCPQNAIDEVPREIGIVESGSTQDGIHFARGLSNIGEPMTIPIIRRLKREWALEDTDVAIRDAPPGTSCPVVESMSGSDFVLLVTEPTPFGLHDLRLAVQVAQEMRLPAGVIINRDGEPHDPRVEAYCREAGLPVLLRIPFERSIAEGIAQGKTLVEIEPRYRDRFQDIYAFIEACLREKGRHSPCGMN